MWEQRYNYVINKYVGKTFVNGKYNCWSLVKDVYKEYGLDVPDYHHNIYDAFSDEVGYSIENIRQTCDWIEVNKLVIPCVILFKNCSKLPNHAGVYIGNDDFLHNLYKSGVVKSSINDNRWKRIIVGYYVYRAQQNKINTNK